jgi:class 3 adenylate cyclase
MNVMNDTSIIESRTRHHIKSSKKHVTILFTDIEDSTKYWDKFGDVQGRLMVDRHNRLLFPVVQKFKGTIIKTIGDLIMSAFSKPEQAIKAAIAMQQSMALERQGDDTFNVCIRIGIHTGEAIVEKEDVYGDIVNVASRVEGVSKGNEILLSQDTVAYVDDEYAFITKKKGWFVPKGKSRKFYVYSCDWKHHPRLIDSVSKATRLPIYRRQKLELGFYLTATFGVFYFIYLKYLRYLVSDSEEVALLYLNFSNILENYPYIVGSGGIILLILSILFIRMKLLPMTIMRFIKGGFIFSISFMIFYLVASYAPIKKENKWNEVLESSYHHYVEILEDNSPVFKEPSLEGLKLGQIPSGHLLLQTDFKKIGDLAWNKVLLGAEKFGWIVRVSPPQMGVPEKIVSQADKFHFRYKDLYTFAFAFLCFIVSFWKFRIRPI